ncbi:MAG: type 3 dihydrofolate reductase [Thiolinea sp.]
MLSLIAAMTPDRVIGRDGRMPWHLPADLAWFKRQTLGKPVLMGRKTWHSLGQKPLPGRQNIIISRAAASSPEGVGWAHSPEAALQLASGHAEVMVIGGGEIYSHFLPQADRLYITLIHASVEGDSWFPEYQHLGWRSVFQEERAADERNAYACSFQILDRLP